ncbi:MAG: TetR/AcrR family transcriptional regulator [Pseudomonadota bacterium]
MPLGVMDKVQIDTGELRVAKASASDAKRRTQEERKAESERRIIRAAVELFAKQGYLKTTLIEVGRAAGYTGGLVSHRFGSKEGLLNAVIDNAGTRFFEDQLRPAIEGEHIQSAQQALRNYISTYFEEVFVRESHIRALYVIMGEGLGSVPEVRPKIAQLNRGMRQRLGDIVRRGIDSGEFGANVDPDAAAVLIVGLLRGVVMQYLADPRAFKKKTVLPMLQNSAVAGLR